MTEENQSPEETSAEPRKHLGHHALGLYRNVNKVDRWAGGGFGLSTLVKLAGWAGLLAILAALVLKVRQVEQQLDPVEHGVAKLQAELAGARQELGHEVSDSRTQLVQLAAQTRELERVLKEAGALDAKTASELAAAQTSAQALRTRLDANTSDAEKLAVDGKKADDELGALAQTGTSARTALQAPVDQAAATLKAVNEGLGKTQTKLGELDKAAAGLSLEKSQAALGKLETSMTQAAQALDKLTAHATALDAQLQSRASTK